jgi:zinc transporter 1/2/3
MYYFNNLLCTRLLQSSDLQVGAFLCHLLPEANQSYGRYLAATYEEGSRIIDFPFGGLVCGMVLAFLVIIDGLIVRKGFEEHPHGHDGASHDHITDSLKKLTESQRALTQPPVDSNSPRHNSSQRHHHDHPKVASLEMSVGSPHPDISRARAIELNARSTESTSLLHQGNGHEPTAADRRKLLLRAWVFFVALSLHGVFDGLSVGSENEIQGFTSTVVAVVSHKLFDGLSLGCAIFPADIPALHRWILLSVSAATTPLGIGIGMAASSSVDSDHGQLVNGIVLSLASGSFAYISLMELLPSSLSDGKWIPLKLLMFVLGFAGMAVLAVYV